MILRRFSGKIEVFTDKKYVRRPLICEFMIYFRKNYRKTQIEQANGDVLIWEFDHINYKKVLKIQIKQLC